MPRWLLARHGQTDWNAEGRIQGGTATMLSEEGLRQSQRLAARLADTPLAAIYSSDYSRASLTAEILAAPHSAPIQLEAGLRERSFGRWEGFSYEEIRASEPELFTHWQSGAVDFRPPGGESVEDVAVRVLRFATVLKAQHSNDETALIVGHGSCLRSLAVGTLGLPADTRRGLALLDNASLSVLEISPELTMLRLWNDAAHWLETISTPGALDQAW